MRDFHKVKGKAKAYHWFGPKLRPKLAERCNGFTVVLFETPGGAVYRGVAECSKQDQYSRKRGFEIALGRAKKAAWEVQNA